MKYHKRNSAIAQLFICAGIIGASIGSMADAQAQPYPGCPWVSGVPGNICSENPPVPGLTPGYNVNDHVPGTWGPSGIYTPIQGALGGVVR